MQFTPKEEKLIRRLRKQDRQWRWLRWVFLAVGALGVVNLVLYGWVFSPLIDGLSAPGHPDVNDVLVIAVFFPKLLVTVGVTTIFFSISWRDWNGNVKRMLLLKLLDAQQKRDESDVEVKPTRESTLPTRKE
jgi:uncharacterized membrane protein HdeD (DUF308 family)